jgi:imidazole glycerol-phosphate synthase subunit HisH
LKVALIKYPAGNVQSVQFALERLGVETILTDEIETLKNAEKIIFPGVGEASTAMQHLKKQKLDVFIPTLTQPVLGICLGMQLMASFSHENNTKTLGIFGQEVLKFSTEISQKVPHVGWNTITDLKGKLFESDFFKKNSQQEQEKNQEKDYFVYFVHSYYVPVHTQSNSITNYGVEFSAGMEKDNFFALQFHPEKSAKVGEHILENFLKI